MCSSCGEEPQTIEHRLQLCPNAVALRLQLFGEPFPTLPVLTTKPGSRVSTKTAVTTTTGHEDSLMPKTIHEASFCRFSYLSCLGCPSNELAIGEKPNAFTEREQMPESAPKNGEKLKQGRREALPGVDSNFPC